MKRLQATLLLAACAVLAGVFVIGPTTSIGETSATVEPTVGSAVGSTDKPTFESTVSSTVASAVEPTDESALLASTPSAEAVAAVPFGPGERMRYKVTVGVIGGAGQGVMEVTGVDTIRGRSAYHLRFDLKGGAPFLRVEDTFQSWMDVGTLASLRFDQKQREIRFRRHRIFEFYPEERRWERTDTGETGTLPTDRPLDDVSFLYFARTLPLEVGQVYTIPRYFREDGNPVVLRVLRKERVTVPLGTFDTVVIQPIIKTRGLFSEGGQAEVYLSDDNRRIPVQVKSRLPVLGYFHLLLDQYAPGEPLASGE